MASAIEQLREFATSQDFPPPLLPFWANAFTSQLNFNVPSMRFRHRLIISFMLVGQQLVQAPELQLARGPAVAGFASLVVQGWLQSPWGVELSNRVLDTGIQRGPEPLACPNPCCDLHNLHILKSCIVYF